MVLRQSPDVMFKYLHQDFVFLDLSRQVTQLYFELVGGTVFVQRNAQHFRGSVFEVDCVCGWRTFDAAWTVGRATRYCAEAALDVCCVVCCV